MSFSGSQVCYKTVSLLETLRHLAITTSQSVLLCAYQELCLSADSVLLKHLASLPTVIPSQTVPAPAFTYLRFSVSIGSSTHAESFVATSFERTEGDEYLSFNALLVYKCRIEPDANGKSKEIPSGSFTTKPS